jgi:cysteine-rich repeat protein
MVAGTQVTSPMTRMMNNGASICTVSGGTTEAQAIVIGLDAVDVLASTVSGGSTACNSLGGGLVQSGSASGVNFANWKTVLKLVYGGENDPSNPGQVICNGPQRTALVNNWGALFQANQSAAGSCAAPSVCSDAQHLLCTVTRGQFQADGVTPNVGTCTKPTVAPLWHAFRRDDTSGTSDVFATILGLSPSTSATANNGFGTAAYCNAMNWETSNGNGTTCALGPSKQFTGPGGVYNSFSGEAVGSQIHRRPPPNTWGDFPDTQSNTFTDADVISTGMQDNDPIRRPCIGTTVGIATKAAEEVCNIDLVSVAGKTVGQLGLVVAVPDAVYIKRDLGKNLFPTAACDGSNLAGDAPQVYNCAPNKPTKHAAECPDGDSDIAGVCSWPAITGFGTACQANFVAASLFPASPRGYIFGDGRFYNMWYTDQLDVDGAVHLLKQSYTLAKSGGGTTNVTIDSAQGMGRLHIVSTIPAKLEGCTSTTADDQIGCFVQADQCSIGYAGGNATTWGTRVGSGEPSNNAALLVTNIAPSVATVQALGKAGEYPLSRKIYFATLEGWNAVAAGGSNNADELALAKNEAQASFINPILANDGFFSLGNQISGGATDAPFCEDFDQQTVCGASSNDNACARNTVAGIPTTSTVCGDGVRGPYEECDDGANNGKSGDGCQATCRCAGVFVNGFCASPAANN